MSKYLNNATLDAVLNDKLDGMYWAVLAKPLMDPQVTLRQSRD